MQRTIAVSVARTAQWCMITGVEDAKRALRARIRRSRAQRLAAGGCTDVPQALLAAGLAGELVARGTPALAAYLAAPGEPDPALLCRAVERAGGVVLLPIPEPGGAMGWAVDDGSSRPHHRLPIPVPAGRSIGHGAGTLRQAGVRVVLVPALAVDRAGARLGQGGGYYDRLLADLDADVMLVAVVHDDEVLPAGSVPAAPHDRPVQVALTPSGLVPLAG